MEKHTTILAIESSCDETAIAVLADGKKLLSNVISSQIEIHTLYGGVVPEIASRHHLNNIPHVFQQALDEAGVALEDIDEIGVTAGPGLARALLMGTTFAKADAMLPTAARSISDIINKQGYKITGNFCNLFFNITDDAYSFFSS